MSPIAFKKLVEKLESELERCAELCHSVRVNRHISRTHEGLDNLESTLRLAPGTITLSYEAAKQHVGSRMDLGDDIARDEMIRHISEVQSHIGAKLEDLAHPSRPRRKGEKESAGFKGLLRQWKITEASVTYTVSDLRKRIEWNSAKKPAPNPIPRPATFSRPSMSRPTEVPRSTTAPRPKPDADEAVVSLKELDKLLDHLKNSWYEEYVGDDILYINVADKSKRTWRRPTGAYIRSESHLAKPARTGSWERRSPRPPTSSSWDDSGDYQDSTC